MVANISLNPLLTSVASGSFNVDSTGYIQGMMLDDPAIRNWIAGGVLDTTETLPMWGGVGIAEYVAGSASTSYLGNFTNPNGSQGGKIFRATAATGSKPLTGFSVFNQAHAMINSPQSQVPLAVSGGQVNFFRLGSKARIAVACDPSLAAYAGANNINIGVAWDYVNQILIPVSGSIGISSATYNSGTGVLTLVLASAPSPALSPGDTVTIASVTGTGASFVNGVQTVLTNVTTTVTIQLATSLSISGLGGSGTLTTGPALSGVSLLDVNIGNSMTVVYSAGTGFANWNRSGNAAIIQI